MFEQHDVLRIFPDIKPRTLISWQEAGFIQPEQTGKGPGSRRLYSFRNVVEIGVIHQLRLSGTPREWVSSYLHWLSKCPIEDDPEWMLIGFRQYTGPGACIFDVKLCKDLQISSMGKITLRMDHGGNCIHRSYTPHIVIIHLFELIQLIKNSE